MINKNSKNRILVMVLSILFMLTLVFDGHVSGFQTFISSKNTPYTWNFSALPNGVINWSIDVSAPAIARESMLVATEFWAEASGGALKFAEGSGGITLEWDSNGYKIIDPMFLAYATFNADSSNNIVKARIVVNACNYTWHRGGYSGVGPADETGKRDSNLDSVILHELGHALGLDHSNKNSSAIVGSVSSSDYPTMNSIIYPGAETLHTDDMAGIRSLYNSSSPLEILPLVIMASPLTGTAPLDVAFAQTGGDSGCSWNFGDGSSVGGIETTHRFLTAGTYTVSVQSNGKSGTATITVEQKGKKTKAAKVKKEKKVKKAKKAAKEK